MKRKISKTTVILIVILLLQIIVRVGVGSSKEYYHMDEAYSYGLMNYDKVQFTDNINFYNEWHNKDYYKDYLSINKDEMFDISPVYENQKNDVHPPFYYSLLRFFSSFTIDGFSKWTGIFLNIIISIGSSIIVYKIAKILLKKEAYALIVCAVTGLTLASLENTIFIRMYELSTFIILLVSYLHLLCLNKGRISFKLLGVLMLTWTIGSLTHYYCIIFFGVLYLMLLIYYIRKKQYQNAILYTAAVAFSVFFSLLIFPHSIDHLFFGYRGKGALEGTLMLGEYFKNFIIYLYIINKKIFNYFLIILILLILFFKKTNRQKLKISKETLFLFIPMIIYLMLTIQASPFKELRYILPISPIIMILMINLFIKVIETNQSYRKIIIFTISVFGLIIISPILTNQKLDFAYHKFDNVEKRIEKYTSPALYVFNSDNNRFLDDIYLFTKIEESYILNSKDMDDEKLKMVMQNKDIKDGIILFINDGIDKNSVIEDVSRIYQFKQREIIQRMNACTIYYLY